MPSLGFETTARDGAARNGVLRTSHGVVDTPAFVAVGTSAAVKSLTPADVVDVGQQVIFANTYHLYLRPGAEVIASIGGIHRFMSWDGPVMTDSGGFQVFSLGASLEQNVGKIGFFPGVDAPHRGPGQRGEESMVTIDEEGVTFRSHLDGSVHRFTPEISIRLQREIGADIILAFDECTSPLHDQAYTGKAMERTHRWAERSLNAFHAEPPLHGYEQSIYGIVQGGWYDDLRRESADAIAAMAFDGLAIGGSLGRTKEEMRHVLDLTLPSLGDERPRHLLGIGEIPDIFAAVARGVDTFDCVAPTRNARNASLIARHLDGVPLERFRLNLRNARFARDERPVDAACPCTLCTNFSRAYLRHLFKSSELLAYRLATLHNLTQMNLLMTALRGAIAEGRLEELAIEWLGAREAEQIMTGAQTR